MRTPLLASAGAIAALALTFFLGASFASESAKPAPVPEPALSDLERETAENPENVFDVIAETRAAVAGKDVDGIRLAKARKALEIAADAFYRKHLRAIAEGLAKKRGADAFFAGYLSATKDDLKAEPSPRYRDQLEREVLSGATVDPKSDLFAAYVYAVGKSDGQAKLTGGVSAETARLMANAQKGIPVGTGATLSDADLKDAFSRLGLRPWNADDLAAMRKAILTEGLGIGTRYAKAYVTANLRFRDAGKTGRIYLRDTLEHGVQKEPLSCEANSIADLANFYRSGTGRTTEAEIFASMPKDERLPELTKEGGVSRRIWGDPDAAFVGKVQGAQSVNVNKLTGYGIHPKGALPVVQAALKGSGYDAQVAKLDEFDLLWSLYEGDPVVFWYVLSDDPKHGFAAIDWTTWDGQPRTGYVGEHTGIAVGAELDRAGRLTKIAYYEGRSEAVHWDDAATVLKKASYFDGAIYPKKRG